eukprot:CAMPEP_0114569438 /NCGR_PEP_ID=MMETSP0114-20121206/16628_1 /TAXON_ID=31324 /ORGANISM="Goniomonas sp, Strain m" /LENGTH=146 /DNA_ID=CAMNT_0001756321 /DNA_START=189 /DNA_END=626 /DNA_ORIENTATION=-
MVAVAMSGTANPAARLAKALSLPFKVPELISLPAKIVIPLGESVSVLGLGDIALPGLIVSLALKCDRQRFGGTSRLFPVAVAGYVVGLLCSMLALLVFNAAQPALLYLVPCVVIPLHVQAWRQGTLRPLWQGPEKKDLEEITEDDD